MENEIKDLLEKNLQMTQEIHEMVKGIKGYIFWQRVMSIIYFLLIVVPIILSILYLPPLLKNMLSPYNELLNTDQSGNPGALDLKSLLEQGLKNPGIK